LATFLEPIAPLFRPATSRRSLERHATGLLTYLPRKNCDTITQALANTSLELLLHLLTDAAWDRQLITANPVGTIRKQEVQLLINRRNNSFGVKSPT
jgi:hypothetical protein